jgi:DNA-binding CsgD family transcriptional regulator
MAKPADGARLERFFANAVAGRRSLETRVGRVVMDRTNALGLSETEADVLRRSALGQSRGEIAASRGTSEHTIRTQIGRILGKTGHGSFFSAVGDILREVARRP